MKIERQFPAFAVSKKGEREIKSGHPWVYDNVITSTPENCENGCIADVFSQGGKYLGSGFYSEKSKIRIRILSNNANETFSDSFFARRVQYAIDYRKTVMGDDFSACRLIFGEADGLCGLTVDKYGDILVLWSATMWLSASLRVWSNTRAGIGLTFCPSRRLR